MLKIKNKKPFFNSKQYFRVLIFDNNKGLKSYYIKTKNKVITIKRKSFMINEKHIFIDNNNIRTVILNNDTAESINPLDFNSVFNSSEFNSAINSKLISETFENITDDDFNITKILLFATLGISLLILFLVAKSSGFI